MLILVVEDERKVASFIRQGLEEEGHTVEVAADGAAALDLLVGEVRYDLVVLDLMLPRRDGFAVLRAPDGTRSEAVTGLCGGEPAGPARVGVFNRDLRAGLLVAR